MITVAATGVNQLASYSNTGHTVNVAAPVGDASQTPGSTVGRILAGWSSTDISGSWEFYSARGRAVEGPSGARWVWISGTSMACPTAWTADARACTGGPSETTFYGAGIVDALRAVS